MRVRRAAPPRLRQGLHFTPELLARVRDMGVDVVPILLHVGLGTFRPVKTEDLSQHHTHVEHYEARGGRGEDQRGARAAGGRCVCVGTTSVRTLETVTDEEGTVRAQSGDTGIFHHAPDIPFAQTTRSSPPSICRRAPCSCSSPRLAGREEAVRVYREAVGERYRFFSFGDAMLIL